MAIFIRLPQAKKRNIGEKPNNNIKGSIAGKIIIRNDGDNKIYEKCRISNYFWQ
jgi:hypothetical protein